MCAKAKAREKHQLCWKLSSESKILCIRPSMPRQPRGSVPCLGTRTISRMASLRKLKRPISSSLTNRRAALKSFGSLPMESINLANMTGSFTDKESGAQSVAKESRAAPPMLRSVQNTVCAFGARVNVPLAKPTRGHFGPVQLSHSSAVFQRGEMEGLNTMDVLEAPSGSATPASSLSTPASLQIEQPFSISGRSSLPPRRDTREPSTPSVSPSDSFGRYKAKDAPWAALGEQQGVTFKRRATPPPGMAEVHEIRGVEYDYAPTS